jgi:tetratricopeptide (TPR) repeat protein
VQLQLGNTKEALQAYEQSLEIRNRLATADPQNAQAQRDLSFSYSSIAEIHLKENKLAEALAWYQKALAIAEKLAALDPLNQTFQKDLRIDKRKIADIEARLKQKKSE